MDTRGYIIAHDVDVDWGFIVRMEEDDDPEIIAHAELVSAEGEDENYIGYSSAPLDDLSQFADAYEVKINGIAIADVSIFRHVHSLSLTDCDAITDLSGLDVQELELVECAGITDLTPVKNTPIITLMSCPGIRDVSMLAGIRVLRVVYCLGVTDYSALGGLYHLEIAYSAIRDVRALGNIYRLGFHVCPEIRDVSALSGVRVLEFNDCPNVTGLATLADVPKLTVRP